MCFMLKAGADNGAVNDDHKRGSVPFQSTSASDHLKHTSKRLVFFFSPTFTIVATADLQSLGNF